MDGRLDHLPAPSLDPCWTFHDDGRADESRMQAVNDEGRQPFKANE